MIIEIDSLVEFEKWLREGVKYKAAIQALDLSKHEKELLKCTYKGSLFLGCEMSDNTAGYIVKTGGVVILDNENVLFEVHRARLYNREELFRGFEMNSAGGYKSTYDYQIYKEYLEGGMENPSDILISLMRRLHDHSITDALMEAIEGRKVVAIMGGHSMERSDSFYLKIAKISRELTKKGFLMVSGGGPGAMEATHIGAYFATRTEKELIKAIDEIKVRPDNAVPNKEYADEDWLHRAWEIIEKYPIEKGKEKECMSIGIPTWLYGHEPPAPFATHIAKYFANSVREDGLLTIAKHGVIFSPGSAGTIQEIFQDTTQNYYASYNKNKNAKKYISPMILFGVKSWTIDNPLWEFVSKLADGKKYKDLLHITDDADKILSIIENYNPNDYSYPK